MAKFDFSRSVMEKILRRAFLDGVIELYENSPDGRIHSVALEGTLSLTINKSESFNIKLFEIAQRAEDSGSNSMNAYRLLVMPKQTRSPIPGSNPKIKLEPGMRYKDESKLFNLSKEHDCDGKVCDPETSRRRSSKTRDETARDTRHYDDKDDGGLTSRADSPEPDFNLENHAKPTRLPSVEKRPFWSLDLAVAAKSPERDDSRESSPSKYLERTREEAHASTSRSGCRSAPGMPTDQECDGQQTGPRTILGSRLFEQKSKLFNIGLGKDADGRLQKTDDMKKIDTDLIVIEDDEDMAAKKELSVMEPGEVWSQKATLATANMSDDHAPLSDMFVTACPLCQVFCQGRNAFLMHVDAHRQSFERSCIICAQGPLQLESMLFHLLSDHTSASPTALLQSSQLVPTSDFVSEFKCYHCDRSFPTVGLLEQHLESHGSSASQSSSSPKSDANVGNFSCELCGEVFSEATPLASHHRMHHVGQSPSVAIPDDADSEEASESGAEPMGSESTQATSPLASSQPLVCQHCARSFRSWRSLKYHLLTCHGLQHACDVCLNAFPTTASLQQHELIHKEAASSAKPVYSCTICNKMFASLTHCTSHKRLHTSAKPHVCDTCGSSFFKRGDLTKHVRTVHCPTKHFVCKVCGRTGTRADNMRVHVKIHQKFMTREQIDLLIDEVYKA